MRNRPLILTALAFMGGVILFQKYAPLAGRTEPLVGEIDDVRLESVPVHPPISERGWIKLALIAILAAFSAAAAYFYNEMRLDDEQRQAAIALTGGDPSAAPALIIRYGCAGCHSISGVPEAAGQIGPPLNNLARQGYVGGVVQNTTENLVNWIVDPRSIDPMSAMPRTGISAGEARDVAAYLLSLRG